MQTFKPKTRTIVRCLIALIAIINSILAIFNIAPISVDDSFLYALATLIGVLYLLWPIWKNNPFTKRECAIENTVKPAIQEDGIEQVIGHLMVDISDILLDEEDEDGNTICK